MGVIYLLELNQGKYYLGYTNSQKLDWARFKLTNWTQKYHVQRVVKYIHTRKRFLNFYVRSYMLYYGMDNVRGGKYQRIKLKRRTKKWILKHTHKPIVPKISVAKICEVCGANDFGNHTCPTPSKKFLYLNTCLKCGLTGHSENKCPFFRSYI